MRKILPAVEFEKRKPDVWTINYEACLAYQQQNGSLQGLWKQRKLYNWLHGACSNGGLKDDRKEKLIELFKGDNSSSFSQRFNQRLKGQHTPRHGGRPQITPSIDNMEN